MFTGLVTDVGEVVAVELRGALRRVRIACSYPWESIALGASVACSGPCLTAVGIGRDGNRTWFDVDVAAETLARTTAGAWQPGTCLNLERSLKIGDELGGHIVSGHIDGMARIIARSAFDGMVRFDVEAPADLAKYIAEKGSVSLDGTSLTVNSVEGACFSVLLIPHTLAVTTWGNRSEGDLINLEVDQMARYAARLIEARGGADRRDLAMKAHYLMFARYNLWANARLYEAAAALDDADYRADRGAFFKSMHGTLNHLLASDRIWMRRFTGTGETVDRLDAILFENFAELRLARQAEDQRLVDWIAGLDEADLAGKIRYRAVSVPHEYEQDLAPAPSHFFNHQTHHRGQAHAVLTGLCGKAPKLDLLIFQRDAEIGDTHRLG